MKFLIILCTLLAPFIFLDVSFLHKIMKAVFGELHQSKATARSGTRKYATNEQGEKDASRHLAAFSKIELPFLDLS